VILWLALAGCAKIPEHLQVHPEQTESIDRTVTDARSAVALLARRDPLVRAPYLPERAKVGQLADAPWLPVWMDATLALEQDKSDPDAGLESLESEWPGTPVVALTRGQRIRLVETALARSAVLDEPTETTLLGWLTPLRQDEADQGLPRLPMDWLATPHELPTVVRQYGERWVLTGWMDGPAIPLDALEPALAGSMYDGLRQTPLGGLVEARATRKAGPVDAGWADLVRATGLALTRTAADRDSEQRAWSDQKKAAAAELGAEDPIGFLLGRAFGSLRDGAADDRAGGGALLAYGAMRWDNTCPDAPCVGLDRVQTIAASARWGAEVAALASIWRVIAVKDSLDHMDVAVETVAFPSAAIDLVDALLGTGSGPLEADLVRVRRGEPATWNALARSVGDDGVTDWSAARAALGRHLAAEVDAATKVCPDPSWLPLLERIGSRAQP
jgi:hypothetical protein